MKYRRKSGLLVAAVVIATSLCTTVAKADEWNKETSVTFSESVEIYQTTLPAGTYIFRLLDSPVSRSIVQVFSRDRQHLITSFIARNATRGTTSHSSIVTLDRETSNIPVVTSWFYPDDYNGRDFPHSK